MPPFDFTVYVYLSIYTCFFHGVTRENGRQFSLRKKIYHTKENHNRVIKLENAYVCCILDHDTGEHINFRR